MTGAKPPLVLIHPFTSSGRVWDELVPLLSEYHEVHTPTMAGHRGGPTARRPATVNDLTDSAVRYLDEHGLERPHIAGNSGGGARVIELARRGRAASVCAISPAGFWSADDGSAARVSRMIRIGSKVLRVLYPVAPLLLKTGAGRRITLRNFICHGERLCPKRALELYFEDSMGCTIMKDLTTEDVAASDDFSIQSLDPPPCPITLAWAEFDRFVPREPYGRIARERLPGATWVDLPGTGHNAFIDDPHLVARTILATTGAVR